MLQYINKTFFFLVLCYFSQIVNAHSFNYIEFLANFEKYARFRALLRVNSELKEGKIWVGTLGIDSEERLRTCSPLLPLRTISYAVRNARADDKIVVLPGIYRGEQIVFKNSGTPDKRIQLLGLIPNSVIILGSTQVFDIKKTKGKSTYHIENWRHFFGKYDQIFLDKSAPSSSLAKLDARYRARNLLFVNDVLLEEVAKREDLGQNKFFCDIPNAKIYFHPQGKLQDKNAYRIEVSTQEKSFLNTNGKNYIRIKNLNFARLANGAQAYRAAVKITGENNIFENCAISKVSGTALTFSGKRHLIFNSTFNSNGQQGLHSYGAENCQIIACETSANNLMPGKRFDPAWEAGGNKFVASKNLLIQKHRALDNNGSGIWVDINNHDIVISDCIAARNQIGIHYEISYTGKIIRNLLAFNKLYDFDPVRPVACGVYISSASNTLVKNNLCYGNEKYGIQVGGFRRPRDDGGGKFKLVSHSNLIIENLCLENGKFGGEFSYQHVIGATNIYPELRDFSGIKSLYPLQRNKSASNIFFGSKDSTRFFGNSVWHEKQKRCTNLRDWQKLYQQDQNSIWQKIKLRDPENGDFRLAQNFMQELRAKISPTEFNRIKKTLEKLPLKRVDNFHKSEFKTGAKLK